MKVEQAIFGGGCFWCTEAIFRRLKGVTTVEPGYAGGETVSPTYEEVATGKTGHAEVTKVEYDPEVISYESLLAVFFATHDPTSLNRQGADVGTEYRSIILTTNTEQEKEAKNFIKELNTSSDKGQLIVTEVKALETFYPAEDFHKDYYERYQYAPYCQVVINPKLQKVKEKFAALLK